MDNSEIRPSAQTASDGPGECTHYYETDGPTRLRKLVTTIKKDGQERTARRVTHLARGLIVSALLRSIIRFQPSRDR